MAINLKEKISCKKGEEEDWENRKKKKKLRNWGVFQDWQEELRRAKKRGYLIPPSFVASPGCRQTTSSRQIGAISVENECLKLAVAF